MGLFYEMGPLAVKKHPLKDSSFHSLVQTSLETWRDTVTMGGGCTPISPWNATQTRWTMLTDCCRLGRLKI